MKYRLDDLEVASDNPYTNDALDRKPVVDFIADLIGRTGGPFVLALDAPWGTGKTTVVKMLMAELQARSVQAIYFNAWRVDHAVDPLVALVSSIAKVELAGGATKAKAVEHLSKIRAITSKVARRTLFATVKAATLGVLDGEEVLGPVVADATSGTVDDLVSAFQREEDLLDSFRRELAETVKMLPSAGKSPTLIWFIDELDRCRPSFAIAMLERIKHLFDVPNVVFVLSIDKRQLEVSTSAVYGAGIDAREYLRRFIDLEYHLPHAPQERLTESMIRRLGLAETFQRRNVANELKDFVEFFTGLAELFELSFRAQERCITRLRVILDLTGDKFFLEPILVSVLVVLRSSAPDVFRDYVGGSLSPVDLFAFLKERPGPKRILEGNIGAILEAQLIASDPVTSRFRERHSAIADEMQRRMEQGDKSSRASALHQAMGYLLHGRMDMSSASAVGARVDLASHLRT